MSFFFAEPSELGFRCLGEARLGGADGAVARFLADKNPYNTPFDWVLNGEAVARLMLPDVGAAELLLDLSEPGVSRLHRVVAIRGHSVTRETDLVMVCQHLPGAGRDSNGDVRTNRRPDSRQWVEALGLTGGLGGGSFQWTRPRMDIGAAICPGAEVASR